MKKDIHPEYYPDAVIKCACGNTFTVGSTVKEIHVEICSNCHPFYTGKETIVDTAGRVDRFKKRQQAASEKAQKTLSSADKKAKEEKRKQKQAAATAEAKK